jgi:hypothetical protein
MRVVRFQSCPPEKRRSFCAIANKNYYVIAYVVARA